MLVSDTPDSASHAMNNSRPEQQQQQQQQQDVPLLQLLRRASSADFSQQLFHSSEHIPGFPAPPELLAACSSFVSVWDNELSRWDFQTKALLVDPDEEELIGDVEEVKPLMFDSQPEIELIV